MDPSHGWAKTGQAARTYIQQVCADTGCRLEHLPEVMEGEGQGQRRLRHNMKMMSVRLCQKQDNMMMT